MEYRETVAEMDKVVKLYRKGLLSVSEAIDRIKGCVIMFDEAHCHLTLDDRLSKENRLYRHGLVYLTEAIKAVMKR